MPRNSEHQDIIGFEAPESEKDQELEFEEELERAGRAIDKYFQDAARVQKTLEQSGLQQSQKAKYKEKIGLYFKRGLRMALYGGALLFAAGTVDYQLTKYKVDAKDKKQSSGIEYTHQDLETTHNLNLLSGKDPMTERDKIKFVAEFLSRNVAIKESVEKLEQLTEAELLAKAKAVYGGNYAKSIKTIDDLMDSQDINPVPEKFDPELYAALWKLEQSVGNPKVRLKSGSPEISIFKLHGPNRSFYGFSTNTVYINLARNEEELSTIIAEASHGKQFRTNPVQTAFRAMRDYAKTLRRAIVSGHLNSAYDKLYEEPGSIENEAHQIIEKKLQKEFEQETPEHRQELKRRRDSYDQELEKFDRWVREAQSAARRQFNNELFLGKADITAEQREASRKKYYDELDRIRIERLKKEQELRKKYKI